MRNLLENEVVRISWWWGKDGDHGDKPVFEETREWSVERLVACPEAGERNNTFSADFLNDFS